MSREKSLKRIACRISAHSLHAREHNDISTYVQGLATAEPLARDVEFQQWELPSVVETFRRALRSVDEGKQLAPAGIRKAVSMLANHLNDPEAFPPFFRVFAGVVAKSERYAEAFRGLDTSFAPKQTAFGAQYRESIGDPTVLLQLDRLLADSLVGSYRVLFPVVDKDPTEKDDGTPKEISAYLLAANISVSHRDCFHAFISEHTDFSPQRRVFVLPWSLFQAHDDKHSSFSKLCNTLPKLIDKKADNYLYWIEFQTLRSDDIDKNKVGDLRKHIPELSVDDVVRAFTPTRFDFEGNSMGLAIGISGWAASQQLCVNHAIATGHVQSKGSIGGIDFLREKLIACSDFHHVSKHEWQTLIPALEKNSIAGIKDSNGSKLGASVLRGLDIKPLEYTSFDDVKKDAKRLLTDGFDTVRKAVAGGKSPAPADTPAQLGEGNDQQAKRENAVIIAFESARDAEKRASGYCRADVEAAERLYDDLVPWLSVDLVAGSGIEHIIVDLARDRLQFFSVPFNEPPSTVANWLVAKLWQKSWPATGRDNAEDRANWTKRPVVLPVSIQALAGESEIAASINDKSLDRLCKAVEMGVRELCKAPESDENTLIHADTLRAACGRPGKLLLIAYEAISLEVPFYDEDKMSQRLAALRLLREVAETTSDSHSKGQPTAARHSVVAIVPDEHYKRWVEHKCQACLHS